MATENISQLLKEVKSSSDGKYISHVPDNFLTKKKIENFLLSRKEEEEKKLILKSKPYKIMIEPTNSCNLGCPLCPTGINAKTRDKGLLKLDEFKKLIDQVKETTIEMYLQNWGEATLVKNLPEMINYASSNGIWVYRRNNHTGIGHFCGITPISTHNPHNLGLFLFCDIQGGNDIRAYVIFFTPPPHRKYKHSVFFIYPRTL